MRNLAAFALDGFKASIALLRFVRDMFTDTNENITALIGTSMVFVKGGVITQAGGNTTITNGIILKDGKLYTFTGGTYLGTPATLKIKFTIQTADGYPLPYYVGASTPTDIYLDNTAKVDAAGTEFLNTVGIMYDLLTLKSKIGKDAWTDISAGGTTPVDGNYTPSVKTIRKYEDATVHGVCFFQYTTARAVNTTVITLPNNGYNVEVFQGYWTGGGDFNPVSLLLSTGGQLLLKTALPASGIRTLVFSFSYKLL
ncbi:MAG TPA: hypothetical protein PK431_01740 [Chitinophagales bacterium]|nr:hypothetical protein [Chitinophagales bacterium]